MKDWLIEMSLRFYWYVGVVIYKDDCRFMNAERFGGYWVNSTGFYKKYPNSRTEIDHTQDRYEAY